MNRDRQAIAPEDGLHIEDIDGDVKSPADGRPLILRHYRQSALAETPLPLLLYMHGGGVRRSLLGGPRRIQANAAAVRDR